MLRQSSTQCGQYLGKRNVATADLQGQIWAYRNFSDRFSDDHRAPRALLLLAAAYGARRDWRRQKDVLQELMARYPESPEGQDAPDTLADLTYGHGRSDTAAAMYGKDASDTLSAEIERRRLVKLARCHVDLLDFDQAAKVFRQLVTKYPDAPETQAILPELVRVAVAAGDIQCTRVAFGKLAEMEPVRWSSDCLSEQLSMRFGRDCDGIGHRSG
ncbi:MAG: tetratricopeptide repeat protein [Planctomycetota bacterium]|jgi:TolA-binding protein